MKEQYRMTETTTESRRTLANFPIQGMVTIPTDYAHPHRLPYALRSNLSIQSNDQRTFFGGVTDSMGLYLVINGEADSRSEGFHPITDSDDLRYWCVADGVDSGLTLVPFEEAEPTEKSEIEQYITGMAILPESRPGFIGPIAWRNLESQDERTFFYAEDQDPAHRDARVVLVCPESDPRHIGMWGPESGPTLPQGLRAWRVEKDLPGLVLHPFDPQPETEEIISVGDKVIVREARYAPRQIDKTGTVLSTDESEVIDGEIHTYLVQMDVVGGGGRTYAMKVEKVAEEEHGTEEVVVVTTTDLTITVASMVSVGDKVKVIDPSGSMFASMGDIVTVEEVDPPSRSEPMIRVRNSRGQDYGMYYHRFERVLSEDQAAMAIDPTGGPGVETRPFTTEETEALDAPERATSADLTRLLEQAKADLEQAKALHAKDMATVSERLNKEAVDRGWCEEYDEITSDLNTDLHIPLSKRYQQFNIDLTVLVPISWRGRATSEEDARSKARGWVDRYQVERQSRHFRNLAITKISDEDGVVFEDDDDEDEEESPF
jgi:hypothetical protein